MRRVMIAVLLLSANGIVKHFGKLVGKREAKASKKN